MKGNVCGHHSRPLLLGQCSSVDSRARPGQGGGRNAAGLKAEGIKQGIPYEGNYQTFLDKKVKIGISFSRRFLVLVSHLNRLRGCDKRRNRLPLFKRSLRRSSNGWFFLPAVFCPSLTSVANFLLTPPPLLTRIRSSPKARQAKSKSRIQVKTRSSQRD